MGSIWKYKTCPVQLHVLPLTVAVTCSWPVLCTPPPLLFFLIFLFIITSFLNPIKLGGGDVGERNKTDGSNGAKSCPAVFSAAISLTIPRKQMLLLRVLMVNDDLKSAHKHLCRCSPPARFRSCSEPWDPTSLAFSVMINHS